MLGGLLGLIGLSAVAGVLVTATVTPAIAVTSYASSSAISLFENIPGYLKVDRPMEPTTLWAKKSDSDEYYELASFYDQNREPVEYTDVAPAVYDALLSSEDPRYYEHGGVDLIGTTRALLSNATSDSTQGGSSISQQYVKNVQVQACERQAEGETQEEVDEIRVECYNDAITAEGTEGYKRKLQEMRYAITIEQEYSKEDILIGYLNLANFGGTTYGIEAAAQRYFSTSASDLTLAQAATLAGMVQNPNTYRIDRTDGSVQYKDGTMHNSAEDGYALTKDRRDYVLRRMAEEGKITADQRDAAYEEAVEPKISHREQGCAAAGGTAYFCQYVKNTILFDDRYSAAFGETFDERSDLLTRGGLDIYTTLDNELQFQAQKTMENHVPSHVDYMNLGATTVQLENSTGRILSMAQNTHFNENETTGDGESSLVYAADQKVGRSNGFPAGSTYKIFTIIDWLENGRSVNERLDGRVGRAYPMSCDGQPAGSFTPVRGDNFGGSGGSVDTVRNFTGLSLNTGFYAMASQLDVCEIHKVADRMGVTFGNGDSVVPDGFPGAFSIVGSFNVAPLAMAAVYGAVANNGERCEPTAILSVKDGSGDELTMPDTSCEQVLDPNIAATTAFDMARVMEGGQTGSSANVGDGIPTFGKTGTHEFEHTWMIQSSSKVTTAAWLGNATGNVKFQGNWEAGMPLTDIRYPLSRENQAAANAKYGGDPFPEPDQELIRVVQKDVPNVAGRSVEEATNILRGAGFQVTQGGEVSGSQDKGRVERTDPSGQAPAGSMITILVSNGKGTTVPNVVGRAPAQAISQLAEAGLDGKLGSCTKSDDAPGRGVVTSTDPGAGEDLSRGDTVRVNYERDKCRGGDD